MAHASHPQLSYREARLGYREVQPTCIDYDCIETELLYDFFGTHPEVLDIQTLTLFNWVEAVYSAFGHALPTASGDVALLAVREASYSERKQSISEGKSTQQSPEADEDRYDFESAERKADIAANPTKYNDLLFLTYVDSDPSLTQHVEIFVCTADPGRKMSSAKGTPFQCEGRLYRSKPGTHNGEKGPYLIGKDPIVALHVYSSAYGKVILAREATSKAGTKTANRAIFEEIDSACLALKGASQWRFCSEEENGTIHIHFSKDTSESVGGWSTGCTALRNSREKSRYKDEFLGRARKAANQGEIPYLVVSSQYIHLFDDVYAKFSEDRSTSLSLNSLAKHVVNREALRPHPDKTKKGLFLPSFLSTEFAEAVEKLANALQLAAVTGEIPDDVEALLKKHNIPYRATKPPGVIDVALLRRLSVNLSESLDACCINIEEAYRGVSPTIK